MSRLTRSQVSEGSQVRDHVCEPQRMGRQVDEHVCEPWDESAAMPVNYRMLQLPCIMALCPLENLPHGTSHGNHISKESWDVVLMYPGDRRHLC